MDSQKSHQIEQDAQDLKKMGYVQELFRDMGGFSSFAVSFSVISILTGATQLYGYGLQHGGPLQMTVGWTVVSFFTLIVAAAMAELSSSYPTAGAVYHWSHILGGKTLGWFTASLNAIGQFAILSGIDYGLSQFIIGLLHWPNTPLIALGLYSVLLISHAALNHVGIRVVSFLNDLSAWYHIVVVLLLVAVISSKGFAQPTTFLLQFNHTDGFPPAYSFLVGLLLAQWTLCGYDASAHVTEETVDPRRRTPWAIFLAVAVSILAGLLMLVFVTLAIPDLSQATAFGETAFVEILRLRLGDSWATAMAGLVAGAMWLCGLAAMTSSSRMIYAFSRDEGLPFSHLWSKVSPRFRTPANAIWGLAAFATVLTVSIKLYSAVVSIATIALYISYALPICARLMRRLKGDADVKGPWHLGKFSLVINLIAVAWIGFITTVFMLPPNKEAGVFMLVLCVLLAGIWFAQVRFRFAGPRLQGDFA